MPLPIAPPPVEKYLNADLPVMAVQVSKMDANESLHSEEDQLDSRPAVSKIASTLSRQKAYWMPGRFKRFPRFAVPVPQRQEFFPLDA